MDVANALTKVAREESGRVLALLARRFNDLDLADEAVQDALLEAAGAWPTQGVPTNPAAWLYTVARRKAIDQLRRRASALRRTKAAAKDLVAMSDATSTYESEGGQHLMDDTPTNVKANDDHLRLIFLCCHPALDRDTQIALTLRLVGGLTTPEIAAAFLIPEATLAQRIVRAKRKIRDANIALGMPEDVTTRLAAVLGVLYLIFNESYLSRSATDGVLRVDLATEAIRLTQMLAELAPDEPEVLGLLALELFHLARFATRADNRGDLVLLEDQDRSLWNMSFINQGNLVLQRMFQLKSPGPLQVQAIIAAHHANARTAADTNWPAIAAAYGQLVQMTPTPVVALNRAVAIAMADGPHAGLTILAELSDNLRTYHLFHAARAELLVRAGDPTGAIDAFNTARTLTVNQAEIRHLDRRLASLSRC